ncbi:MAG TPA: dTMP kinase [Blastocatellia bacterium]|nr:dTMP kinase [Blastocatellia bacterium]
MIPNPHLGKIIVFEGLDGSGQTTQAQLLVKWFSEKRNQLAYYTKEPTDGPVGSLLKLALAKRLSCSSGARPLDEVTMALFFAADRADHLNNDIVPKLENSIHVIADRYYLSSLAYQSMVADYDWIKEINKHALRPDLTFFLDVPPAICVKRMQAQRWHIELYEDLRTLQRVHRNFLESIQKLKIQGERIEMIDGNQPLKDVHKEIVHKTKSFFKSLISRDKRKRGPDVHQLELLMNAEPLTEAEIATHQEG